MELSTMKKSVDRPMKIPCLFLDRDGIINEDLGYVYDFMNFKVHESILKVIGLAQKEGWKICVLTNQSGVARGYYLESHISRLHQEFDHFLLCHGLKKIDGYFYSVDLDGPMRKPEPGMLQEALEKFSEIDPCASIMVGDKVSDVLKDIRLSYFLVRGHYDLGPVENSPNYSEQKITICNSLEEFYFSFSNAVRSSV